MSNSGLPYTVALQDDLVLGNAMGAITVSSAQYVEQRYPANSEGLSQIQFQNIKLSGSSSLFDSQWFLEYQVDVQADLKLGELLPGLVFNHNANVSGMTVAIDNNTYPILASNSAAGTFTTNIGNLAFRSLPLSRNCSSLQIALNNANNQNYNLQQQLALCNPLTEDDRSRLSGLCPVDDPRSVVIPDFYNLAVGTGSPVVLTMTIDPNYKGGNMQPNNPYWNCGRNFIKVSSIVTPPNNGVYKVRYTVREPVLANPFTVGYSGTALGNLDSITINYSLDSSVALKGMFVGAKNYSDTSANPPTLSGLAVTNISGSTLIARTLSVDPSVVNIPPIIYYDFDQYTFSQTTGVEAPSAGSSATKQTQSIALNTVPKLYVAKIQPLSNALNSLANQQIGASITQLTVNYGTLGRFVFDQVQLYKAYIRNSKVNKTFNEWVDDCTVILNPALDFQNTASSFTGVSNMGSINFVAQYTYTCDNYLYGGMSVPSGLNVNEMFINQGNIAVGQGQATYTTTTISSGQLVAAMDKPLVSDKVLHSSATGKRVLRGGGIFSSLGNVLRGAAQALPGALGAAGQAIGMAQNAVNHPIVQSALAGLTGGSMRRRR